MWRRAFAAPLALGLALLLAACGSAAGPTPTPTVVPTKTPTPSPCATWRVVPSPIPTQYAQSRLAAVSALSPSEAWAVGANYTGEGSGQVATLIERWDGSAWRITASPGAAFLNGVAAVTSNDVWAVGGWPGKIPGSPSGRLDVALAHWNGSQWSAVAGANPSATVNTLMGVAALAAGDVWAVGSYATSSGATMPLIERWDGTAWRVVANPALSDATDGALNAVARIPGTSQLWAVGYTLKAPRPAYEQPLIEQWDGSAWRLFAGPTLPDGAYGSALNSVVALSAMDAWAVGDYTASDHTTRTLIAHWDGTAWTTASSPDERGSLAGVAAAGLKDVRAVGRHLISNEYTSAQIGIIEQWDGSTWRVIESPTPQGVTHSNLTAVAADGAGGYWAVGWYPNATSNLQPLIARCA